MISSDEPFRCRIAKRWIPTEMMTAPALGSSEPGAIEKNYALLINPFLSQRR